MNVAMVAHDQKKKMILSILLHCPSSALCPALLAETTIGLLVRALERGDFNWRDVVHHNRPVNIANRKVKPNNSNQAQEFHFFIRRRNRSGRANRPIWVDERGIGVDVEKITVLQSKVLKRVVRSNGER